MAFRNFYLDILMEGSDTKDRKTTFDKLILEKWEELKTLIDTTGYMATKGYSEQHFAEYIRQNSQYTVHNSVKLRYYNPNDKFISDEDLETRNGNRDFFYPDITVIDEASHLIFDIEIDEPYSLADAKPIHYVCYNEDLEEHAHMKREDYRNGSLAAKGFVVVKFAEEQIVKYPDACLNLIKGIAQLATSYNGITEISLQSLLAEWDENMEVGRWTVEEAREMAANAYRNTYLLAPTCMNEVSWVPKVNSVDMEELARMINKYVKAKDTHIHTSLFSGRTHKKH